ncbi:TfoX/Sxy family transcriptional regulator of competence genes [Rhodococcus fascians]|uniref:TfoX/Sxy family protein n=1 Tax=Nocardiaceae TaxID=85025 RepID=UPI00285D3149|nr:MULTISPECIES: TfoX/Sxy family protein [Rhodococcus]MDR6911714.1 TfoX/Sxy family transcriptional regulator of competence genes [Rhodococcus sp. 3258]MDR6933273.1 TfoX/Sxy family transcriptional regulator of competence genes [Rhodococcus fascians]
MAYDELLADRIRDALSDQESLREQKMFGGLAFMVRDRMVVCVGTENRALLVRVDGVREPEYLQLDGAHHAVMGKGRSMGEGWITVDAEALTSEQALQFWVGAALEHNADTSG